MMQPSNNPTLAYKQHVMSPPLGEVRQRIARVKRRVGCCTAWLGLAGIAAAILFPVFVQTHDGGHHSSCISNQRQLGMALLQYAQDYDETFPCGARNKRQGATLVKDTPRQAKYHVGQAWAGGLYPYSKNATVFLCSSVESQRRHNSEPRYRTIGYGTEQTTLFLVSYAYNRNVALNASTSGFAASASTVMLAEVDGGFVNVRDADEHNPENIYSPAGNGLSILAATDGAMQSEAAGGSHYATGIMGGYGRASGCMYWPFHALQSKTRHSAGSMYLMADGHAKFFKPEQMSPGDDALSSKDAQDCAGHRAAGAAHLENFAVTFSIH